MTDFFRIIKSESDWEDCRRQTDCHLRIQGNSGGETFLTVPISMIEAGFKNILLLMHDLEHLDSKLPSPLHLDGPVPVAGYDAWIVCSNGPTGGDPNVKITDELWISPTIGGAAIRESIKAVLSGQLARIAFEQMRNGSEG
jgi:hypothetical protein